MFLKSIQFGKGKSYFYAYSPNLVLHVTAGTYKVPLHLNVKYKRCLSYISHRWDKIPDSHKLMEKRSISANTVRFQCIVG